MGPRSARHGRGRSGFEALSHVLPVWCRRRGGLGNWRGLGVRVQREDVVEQRGWSGMEGKAYRYVWAAVVTPTATPYRRAPPAVPSGSSPRASGSANLVDVSADIYSFGESRDRAARTCAIRCQRCSIALLRSMLVAFASASPWRLCLCSAAPAVQGPRNKVSVSEPAEGSLNLSQSTQPCQRRQRFMGCALRAVALTCTYRQRPASLGNTSLPCSPIPMPVGPTRSRNSYVGGPHGPGGGVPTPHPHTPTHTFTPPSPLLPQASSCGRC